MAEQYYLAENGAPVGPMTLDELLDRNLKPDSLVWKPGMEQWMKAAEMPELASQFPPEPELAEPEERRWYAMFEGHRQAGPHTISELMADGLREDTPVWTAGMSDWAEARTVSDFNSHFQRKRRAESPDYGGNFPPTGENGFAQNPQYNDYFSYGRERRRETIYNRPNQDYNNPYQRGNDYHNRPQLQTNWLPWAIGATVAGFFCSCIGAIFGIIGIVQANKANTLYSQGYDAEAERANGNAKIMTIIGFIFAGIGIIATIFLKGVYSAWLNF